VADDVADGAAAGNEPVLGAYGPGAEYASSGKPRTAAASVWAVVFGAFGEALITLGLIIALYVVYELWWSNITAAQETHRNSVALLREWQQPGPAAPSDAVAQGQGFGFLYIPALGADWRALIMQSVDRASVLNTGAVGHYTDPASALPWDATGNFALAGHRDGHGMIFRNLDQLAVGDKAYVQTRYGWFVYRFDREASSVPIADIGAVEPIPQGSGYTKPGRYLTLTTCTPIYIDSSRMVWWGHLIEQTPREKVPTGVRPLS